MLRHLVMPVTILGLSLAGQFTRYVRASVIAELHSDYVRTALAKGVARAGVVFRHVLRNAMIPVITVVALSFPGLLAGAVVIETVFAWPGMGQLSVAAVQRPRLLGDHRVRAALRDHRARLQPHGGPALRRRGPEGGLR